MNKNKKYQGVIIPMITPLNSNFSIDKDAVARIINLFMDAEVCPFVIGTTGEAPSLTSSQKSSLVESVVKEVKGRDLVYAGISSTCQEDSIRDARAFSDMGVDVLVATLPPYYPMEPEQLYRYFMTLADSCPRPLIIYNMPATVKISIPLDIIDRLSQHPNIVGLKDSERDEDRMMCAINLWKNRSDFAYLIGWAAMSAKAMMNGADGIVPSTGNFAPEIYKQLIDAALESNEKVAFELQEKTNKLSLLYQKDRILSESIPALKEIMNTKGLCSPVVMPPMYEMSQNERDSFLDQIAGELSTLSTIS